MSGAGNGPVPFPESGTGLTREQEKLARKLSENYVQAMWMQGVVLKGIRVTWADKDGNPVQGPEDIATGFQLDLDFFKVDQF